MRDLSPSLSQKHYGNLSEHKSKHAGPLPEILQDFPLSREVKILNDGG